MGQIVKIISGAAFILGALLIALMVAEIDIGLNAYRQFQLAIVFGIIGGVLNLLNWKSSVHKRLFTQLYWSGFILLLVGVLLFLPYPIAALFFLVVGILVFAVSFKWSPARQKQE